MNIFEQASKEAFRFPSLKGDLTTEHLWTMPLTSKGGFDLDTVAKTINAQLKEAAEESFVAKISPAKALLETKLEIVKHVIASKMAAVEALKVAAERSQKRGKLIEILSKKQDAELENLTEAQLKEQLKSLE